MKSTRFKTKTEKGITLIALIITIVVLMILAAVAINSITNEGILSQAGSTANQYNQSVKNEQSYLQDYEDMLTAANGGYETYDVGEKVTIGTESFYVIEDKISQGKVVLLSEYCIIADKDDTNYLKQSSSASKIAFSKTDYWTNDFTDLTETGVPDESHYAARAAYAYGVKTGGKGRLMTYNEANTLVGNYSEMIYGPTGAKLNYWLGSAQITPFVWIVYGDGSNLSSIGFDGGRDSGGFGVRPVVEISKSKLS